MEYVLVSAIVGASVWYLVRGFVKSIKAKNTSCSCSGQKACGAVMKLNALKKTEYKPEFNSSGINK